MSISLIMMGAGDSTRFGLPVKKQWLRIKELPMWLFVTQKISKMYDFDEIFLAVNKNEINYMRKFSDYTFCIGGKNRQESLKNALKNVKSTYVLVCDVARVCTDEKLVSRVLEAKGKADCIVPALGSIDSVYYDNKPIQRDKLKKIQTPQLSLTKKLKQALDTNKEFTDDSSAIFHNGGTIEYVLGDESARKLTCKEDIKKLSCLCPPATNTYIGNGFDVHAFGEKRALILCGVKVHDTLGLKAHSDGDVAVHALIDSLLGAMGGGDIGELFPDNDPKFKNVDSLELLKKVKKFIYSVGYEVVNCDITIIAQYPKIKPFKNQMQKSIAHALNIEPIRVNIKATTTENLGFIGREEGIAVLSSASLKFFDWTKI